MALTSRPAAQPARLPARFARALVACAALALASEPLRAQVPATAYPARRAAAIARLGTDVLVVPARASFLADDQMGYVQAPDFQYLTGLDEQVGAVLLLDGRARSATLFVPRPSPLVTLGAIDPSPASAERLRLTEVLPIDLLEERLTRRFAEHPASAWVAAVDARGAVATPLPMASSVARWRSYLLSLGATNVEPALGVLRTLREVKSADEIAVLRRVGKASGEAFLAGLRALRPGRMQRETELAVVEGCVQAGARSVSFWPWTMSGPNAVFTSLFSSFQSYEHNNRAMQAGELVRVDVGCQVDHYMGDVGRTAPASGTFTPGQREAWDLFIAGYKAGLPLLREGATRQDVFNEVLAEIRRRAPSLTTPEGKKAAATLLGPDGTAPWEIHGVGLDDAEGLPETLRAGMVVAYELMFAVDGDGFYLEDMIAIGTDGHEVLTPGLPYTAAEIEAAMAGGRPAAAPVAPKRPRR